VACPYDARVRVDRINSNHQIGSLTDHEKTAFAGHKKGKVEKCNFCEDKVSRGEEPVCVTACPTNARIFGDINDPTSKISKTIAARHVEQIYPKIGNNPSVFYIVGSTAGQLTIK
jgi:molybdopterin-containing oxidoreductase family iron-sulfur binding subunit